VPPTPPSPTPDPESEPIQTPDVVKEQNMNTMQRSLIPEGVKQKVPVEVAKVDVKLQALEEMLRDKEEQKKEETTTQQAGTAQFPTKIQHSLKSTYLKQDVNFKQFDEKLGNFNSTLNQQNQISSEIEKAMAANTLDKKSELWRIQRLNDTLSALGTQIGLEVPSNRQYKKAKKLHRLSQQSSWI
jgi:hypothetical protein